jgi:hypothetical protein
MRRDLTESGFPRVRSEVFSVALVAPSTRSWEFHFDRAHGVLPCLRETGYRMIECAKYAASGGHRAKLFAWPVV